MGDFFKEEETKPEEATVEKIKLGEKEYTQEELSDLVGIAEQTREIESKYNTKMDRVYPEFTKVTQRNKELEGELKTIKTRGQSSQDINELNEDSIKQAREAAKKIGIVTKDDFAQFMQEHFRPAYQAERQAEKLLDDCKGYEKEIDGSNGQPKFKTEEVLRWMQDNGGKNPKQAYKMMYEKEIDTWKDKELGKARKPGMVTEDGVNTGGKSPAPVKVTRDNLEEMIRESLGQGK